MEKDETSGKIAKVLLWIVASILTLIIVVGAIIGRTGSNIFNYLFNERIEVGHIQISDLSKTEKLKVLTMYKEVIVSQYKQEHGRFFGTNDYQIHSIFPGRVDIGFDLSKCTDDWITIDGDTAIVSLPAVEILNKDNWLIDEAKKQTPIEDGKWSAADYDKMALRANALIKRNCELDNCYSIAEEQGFKVISNLLKTFGYSNVKINIQHRENYKPYYISSANHSRYDNAHEFWTDAEGKDFVKYENGAKLYYQGNFEGSELLSMVDLFNEYTIDHNSRRWDINRQQSFVSVSIHHENIAQGSTAANAVVRNADNSQITQLKAIMASIFSPHTTITFSLLDKDGKLLKSY